MKDFFAGRTVLVTGHRGFIGQKLCTRLKELGANVFGLDRNDVDVKNFYQVSSLVTACDPSVVFHLAAKTEVRASFGDPFDTYRTNVLGTLNVLETCRRREGKVKALVVASTDKVYGDATLRRESDEDDPLWHNADIYASSKRAADELAQDYCRLYGMPVRILRCANVYGPGQRNETTLITNTICRLVRGERPVVHAGSRHTVREWLYVDDAVEAYLLAAVDASNHNASTGTPIYNVGSGERDTVEEVVRKCLFLFGKRFSALDFDLESETSPQIGDQGLDSTKFRHRFPQWKATSFEEGLRRTAEWYRDNVK